MAQEDPRTEREGGVELVELKERDEQRARRPPMYRVIILNDDYTPISLVVEIVRTVFRKTAEEAAQITLEVHNKGAAVAGVYTYEIAETKVAVAEVYAAKADYPLKLTLEPDT